MEKPFLTIDEQLSLLESRGMILDDGSASILMAEGYYAVVNGYKRPFIDRRASEDAGEDRYKPGTRLKDIYLLFLMDRALREATFHGTIKAEAVVRTACTYCFAEAHRDPESYLVRENFADEAQYASYGLSDYGKNLNKLQGILESKKSGSLREPIVHYRETYGSVPIWVLSLDLTFGNIEHFFNLMKPEDRLSACKMIASVVGGESGWHEYIDPKNARVWINTAVKVRNICAHDERLYCARIGNRKNMKYTQSLRHIGHLLPLGDFERLIDDVSRIIDVYSAQSEMVARTLEGVGVQTT